jgi:hypothetical protein
MNVAVMHVPLGQVVMTRGLAARFPDLSALVPLLGRHASGDWGEVNASDAQANIDALRTGARVLSAYVVGGVRVWVITEADRSHTTLLLPEEY